MDLQIEQGDVLIFFNTVNSISSEWPIFLCLAAKRELKGLLVTFPLFNEAWSYGQLP